MRIGILGDLCLSFADSTAKASHIIEDCRRSNILKELNNNKYNIVNLEAPITNFNVPIKKPAQI